MSILGAPDKRPGFLHLFLIWFHLISSMSFPPMVSQIEETSQLNAGMASVNLFCWEFLIAVIKGKGRPSLWTKIFVYWKANQKVKTKATYVSFNKTSILACSQWWVPLLERVLYLGDGGRNCFLCFLWLPLPCLICSTLKLIVILLC